MIATDTGPLPRHVPRGWHNVAVDLRDVLPLLRKGRREELGEVLLEEREDQDVPHRRQRDDEDDQKGDPQAVGPTFLQEWLTSLGFL